MQFLLDSLRALEGALAGRGSRLVVVAGKSVEVVPRLARTWKADRVVAQRWVEPSARERDRRVREALGGKLELYEGETLLPPGTLRTGAGNAYAVFSQFARCFGHGDDRQAPAGAARYAACRGCSHPGDGPADLRSSSVSRATRRSCPGASKRRGRGSGGSCGAPPRRIPSGAIGWTSPAPAGCRRTSSSARSPCARSGPRSTVPSTNGGARCFLNELVWREFTHSTFWDRPELLAQPFRPGFVGFPWTYDEALWTPGWGAGQAIPSWTPRRASCSARASCTTARA